MFLAEFYLAQSDNANGIIGDIKFEPLWTACVPEKQVS